MKALFLTNEDFGICEIPVPEPGPGEVLVKVAYSGICRTDLYVIERSFKSVLPLVPGHEFSGTVESDSNRFTEGQRVGVNPIIPCKVCPSCEEKQFARCIYPQMLGVDRFGSFCEYISVPEEAVYPVSDSVDLKHAAYAEPVAACLAVLNAGIKPNQSGCLAGNNRISRLTKKLLSQHGFHSVSLDLDCENHYDFVIETHASEEVLKRAVKALKPGGTLIIKSRSHTPVPVNFNLLIKKEISLKAVNYAEFNKSIDALEKGLQLDDLIGEEFSLDDYKEAFRAALSGESRKIFFRMI
jgi:L-iditol 2-dehydrogenase